jgi:DNA-binding IclR family transcriptional regulator
MGVKAIADALQLVPSTCLHILRSLHAEGLIGMEAGSKRYRLGSGMLSLARSVILSDPFPRHAQALLQSMADRWGVTSIGVELMGGDHMTVMALAKSQSPFSLHVDVGSRFPALISATGRLVAAFGGLSETELRQRFHALRWDQRPKWADWLKQVQEVRLQGVGIDRGQYIAGLTIIAVPILNAEHQLTHALVSASLQDQLTATAQRALVAEMKRGALLLGGT